MRRASRGRARRHPRERRRRRGRPSARRAADRRRDELGPVGSPGARRLCSGHDALDAPELATTPGGVQLAPPMTSGWPARQTVDVRPTRRRNPMAFHPYLFLSGTCRQAFTRYQEVFGGELVLMPMSEAPPDQAMPGVSPDLIMHAALSFDGNVLMGSDDPTGDGGPMKGISVNYTVGDVG